MRHMPGALAAALAAAAACASPAEAADAVHIGPAPGSAWEVHYGDDRCRLGRFCGEGKQRALLLFEQVAPGKSISLTIAGPAVARLARERRVELLLGPAETEPSSGEPIEFGDLGPAILVNSVSPGRKTEAQLDGISLPSARGMPQIDLEAGGAVEWIRISGDGREVVLDLPSMRDSLAALNNCAQGLIEHWGLDVEQHNTMSRGVEPLNYTEVVKAIVERYSSRMPGREEQANIMMLAMIGADGSVTDCSIIEATQIDHLESPACRAARHHGRFAPALDAAGQPMRSYYTANVRYRTK